MHINKITLENFRNYKKAEIELSSDLVLIVGENASGKTNFLESIYFLSNLKSFRAPDNMVVNHQEDFFSVKGSVDASEPEELEVVVQKNPVLRRGYKVNGQKTKRIAWNTFRTVLFVPNDLNMFTLGPDSRRKFLNEALVEKESLYAIDLASLDHVLKQRGALLEKIREGSANAIELDFWNRELAVVAVRISRARRNFIDYLNDKFNHVYKNLTEFDSHFQIIYKGLDGAINEQSFIQILLDHQNAEIKSGMNLIGPHRDDFMILKEGLQSTYNSSRGELREQILTLKILQAEYISVAENKPIILLDDVFSELDQHRRFQLLRNLTGHQVFITSTEHQSQIEQDSHNQLIRIEAGNFV